MNPIKPKKIHEIYIAVSISEEIFFIDGCSSHLALSERGFRYVNIRYEISHRRIANKPKIPRIRLGLTRCVVLR